MLSLSCLPCGDRLDCDNSTVQTTLTSTDHSDHEHSTESCTPFCSCACCATSVVYQLIPVFKNTTYNLRQRKIIMGKDDINSYDLRNIWQPPQLI